MGLLLGTGGVIGAYLLVHVPDIKAAATAQSNVFLYSDGSVLARTGEFNRQNVSISQIPKQVQEAVLAAEDRDFFTEPAVDPQAMVRAAWNMATGGAKQSGSTITQQYVKNTYLGQEQTLTRKAKEVVIAVKLARTESKQDILQGYLNTSYFGRNAYGIQAAAQAYYGKNASQLTAPEGAYLATLLNSPSALDVITNPSARPQALARWNYVLDGMVKQHWLDEHERAALVFPEPIKPTPSSGLSGQRGYLVEAVKQYLVAHKVATQQELARGGYRITTTIDKAREDAFVQAVEDKVNSKIDPNRPADRNVRVGGASIDPATGKVVAMYGGIDYVKQYVNNATRRDFTPGSTFKPLVFLAALDHHSRDQAGQLITAGTIYNGDNKTPVKGSPVPYAPENEDHVSYGPITVSTATDKSVNSVYAQMAVDVGPAQVKKTAIAVGIPSDVPAFNAGPAIALGTMQASPLDMAQAYATLAAHGRYTPYSLVDAAAHNGKPVTLPERAPVQAVSRKAADTLTAMLQGTVANGTAKTAGTIGREAAAKTGTAEDDQAASFAGYTPDLATAVSVMGQDPDTGRLQPLYEALGLKRVNGGGPPADVWAAYTKAALEGSPAVPFDLTPLPSTTSTPSPPPSSPPARRQGRPPVTPPVTGPSGRASAPPASSSPPSAPPDQGGTPSNNPPSDPPDGDGGTDGGLPDDGTT
ncbi:transglycosylase domain-containing protein [Streptomyces vinaceus]|uniref:transglycosylase domain-containing protein n=1 Tax=Streptomyces vinaceus TaxID=1960 RepID=UPI0035D7572B